MFDYSPSLIAAVIATFFAAGVVKGVTGMGLPTVAMGVLGSLLSPLIAAALLLVPSFVTNVWQLLAGRRFGMLIRRLWTMMLTIIVGTVFGSMLLTGEGTDLTTVGLGIALVIYAAYTLLARPLNVSPRWEPWLSPAIGLVTGLVTGATGVFVIPAVPYIQSLNLERDDLVQALGLSFTVSTIALATGLLWHGGRTGDPYTDQPPTVQATFPDLPFATRSGNGPARAALTGSSFSISSKGTSPKRPVSGACRDLLDVRHEGESGQTYRSMHKNFTNK